MDRIPRYPQRSLYTMYRRAGVWLRRFVLNRFVRVKHARKIKLRGRAYKRITYADSYIAANVARNLRAFRDLQIFPKLIAIEDNELLLEYVAGVEPPVDAAFIDHFVDFFSAIYSVDRRRLKLADTDFERELRENLTFLADIEIISRSVLRDLLASVDRIAPDEVWVGFDYMDALPKNFVLAQTGGNRLVAIDVEDLSAAELIGGGVAKAMLRVLPDHREPILRGLAAKANLDLSPEMPFIELYFLARWTKRAYLKGREKLVDAESFEPHRNPTP